MAESRAFGGSRRWALLFIALPYENNPLYAINANREYAEPSRAGPDADLCSRTPFGSAPGMPAAFALIANSAEAEPPHVFRFIEISPVGKFFYWKDWCITGYLSTIEFTVRGAGAA